MPPVGVAYLLSVLGQDSAFDSLHWWAGVRRYYALQLEQVGHSWCRWDPASSCCLSPLCAHTFYCSHCSLNLFSCYLALNITCERRPRARDPRPLQAPCYPLYACLATLFDRPWMLFYGSYKIMIILFSDVYYNTLLSLYIIILLIISFIIALYYALRSDFIM